MEIGLKSENIEKINEVLQNVLANQHMLYQKLRGFHWNITGKHFLELHEFYEEVYTDLAEDIDVIAERIRSLNKIAPDSFTKYAQMAKIREFQGKDYAESSVLPETLADFESMTLILRESADTFDDLDDIGNEDVVIAMMQKFEKRAWMIRSILA